MSRPQQPGPFLDFEQIIQQVYDVPTNALNVNATVTATIGDVNIKDSNGNPIVIGQQTMANSLAVVIASNQSAIPVTLAAPSPISVVNILRNDYTVNAATTGAYLQILASTSAAVGRIEIFDSSGQTLVLATGAMGSEVNLIYIFPGGNGQTNVSIPSGTRLSVKAISANATVGELDMNLYSM
jgi:hypothetical protein